MSSIFPPGSGGFLNPERIVNFLPEIKQGDVIADFGCGHGYFAIPIAKKVGSEGKVFALDILEKALEATRSKARLEGVENIETIRCNLEKNSTLADESVDVVLIANLLFQTEDDEGVIREAKRVLKKGGKIIVIDWKKDSPLGPRGKRISEDELKNLMQKEGLNFVREFETDRFHFGMIFEK